MGMRQVVRGVTGAVGVVAVLAALAAGAGSGTGATLSSAATTGTGSLTLVQAVPGRSMTISVDDKMIRSGAASGAVIGPMRLGAGTHRVSFVPPGEGTPVTATVLVGRGTASDVVLHYPATRGGAPLLTSYQTPTAPIGPGKSRLLLAHTATVAPADVRFDGRTVFRNIANGEFAEADVPEGAHQVALLPTGKTSPALLGPLSVTLAPSTVTMVYAVGDPEVGSMDVVTHVVDLDADGDVVPDQIRTGSAGLAAHLAVRPFSTRR